MKKILIASLLAMSATAAFAAANADAPPADCEGVKVATGPKGKGYSLLYKDIQKLCGSKVAICEVNTGGGLDNVTSLSTKDADMGFVPVDTWNLMKNGDDNIAALQNVMPLNNNYLHIVTAVNGFTITGEKKFAFLKGDTKQVVINRFSDLRGHRVAVVGSTALLGRQLDKQFGYNMQFVDAKDDAGAFEMLKKGQVAAVFTISGWPNGIIKTLSQADGLTLVPFDASVGEPYKVKPLTYKNIAVYNNNSLGVQNILVTRPFSGERANKVAALQSCIMQNLTELKEGSYQPGWNEVNVNSTITGMTAFKKK